MDMKFQTTQYRSYLPKHRQARICNISKALWEMKLYPQSALSLELSGAFGPISLSVAVNTVAISSIKGGGKHMSFELPPPRSRKKQATKSPFEPH